MSWGVNYNTLDPFYYPDAEKLSVHAEDDCIRRFARVRRLGRTVSDVRERVGSSTYVLYVVRLNRAREVRFSAPCMDCQGMIDRYGFIRKVVHS